MRAARPVPRLLGRAVPPGEVAWLTLVWLLLWGDLSVGNVLGGLLAGIVIVWLLPLPLVDSGIRVHPVAALVFLLRFAGDLVLSSLRVAFWALRVGTLPPVEVVEVRLRTSSEVMTVLITVALSALPGSLVLEVDFEGRGLVLHVLGIGGTGQRVREIVQTDVTRLERAIVAGFGTPEDREELR
ncbi:Na+/H+ antiporter subunit E [Streptosporangium sp. NPDC051022]|uniref:Na+/H+ antiporter subunit E n=1 Tax=Streptosporangium sp. NPDC051022 TaxID=3155752 RepID=UPI0034319F63